MRLSTLLSGVIGEVMVDTMKKICYSYNTKEFYIVLGLMFVYGLVQLIDGE